MAEVKKEVFEREYVIPIRSGVMHVARYRKAEKAIKVIKEFIARHMKVYDRDLKKVRIDKFLNEYIWNRGIRNPPHKIKVKAIKEGEIVRVELVEMPDKLKFKKIRMEKENTVQKEKALKKKEEKIEKEVEEKTEEVKEAEEKTEASMEYEQKIEKDKAKEMKHTTKAKTPKQEKNDRKEYNKSSRGH